MLTPIYNTYALDNAFYLTDTSMYYTHAHDLVTSVVHINTPVYNTHVHYLTISAYTLTCMRTTPMYIVQTKQAKLN